MAFIRISMLLSLLLWQAYGGCAQGTRKTMLEQLAALKGYIITAEKGYHLAEEGLHLVRDIKSGEVGLHELFFGSLRIVDAGVLQSPSLDASYRIIAVIDHAFRQTISTGAASGWLRPEEIQYVRMVQKTIADRDENDREMLQVLTGDGILSMTDGERIRQIHGIQRVIRTRYNQVKAFLTGMDWLIAQRQKEHAFTGILKKWYGIE